MKYLETATGIVDAHILSEMLGLSLIQVRYITKDIVSRMGLVIPKTNTGKTVKNGNINALQHYAQCDACKSLSLDHQEEVLVKHLVQPEDSPLDRVFTALKSNGEALLVSNVSSGSYLDKLEADTIQGIEDAQEVLKAIQVLKKYTVQV